MSRPLLPPSRMPQICLMDTPALPLLHLNDVFQYKAALPASSLYSPHLHQQVLAVKDLFYTRLYLFYTLHSSTQQVFPVKN